MVHFVENHQAYFKTKIIYISAIICLLVIIVCGYFIFVSREDSVVAEDSIVKTEESKKTKKKVNIKVDVKGAVKNPGVYELKKGSRVIDAINKAGGLTKEANTSIINLSKVLEDAFVIVVYTDNDLKDVVMDKYVENNVACPATINDACIVDSDLVTNNNSNSKTTSKTTNSTKKSSTKTSTSKDTNAIVNINTASLAELQKIPGVGESKAQAIITYREENGGFKSIEEITNVSGIGDSTFEKIKSNITI